MFPGAGNLAADVEEAENSLLKIYATIVKRKIIRMTSTTTANPLLQIQFEIPFDQIRAENVEPAIAELLTETRAELDQLIAEPAPRTFANTMQRLDHLTERLEYAMQIIRNLEAVATTPELRAAYNTVQPQVSEFYSSLPLNEGLWGAVQGYSKSDEGLNLTGIRKRFLEKTMDNFRRHGAELDAAGKKRIAEIDVDLTKQTIRFSENVLDSTNQYEWVITDERLLAGLPESARAMARSSAASKGMAEPSWRFTLQGPSYLAVMTYLDDAELRRKVYEAFVNRATEEKLDNRPILRRILELRREKARLLGYRDFADLVLEDRMAHTGERAKQFLSDLKQKTLGQFHQENASLVAFSGKAELRPWDIAYYAEKQRAALYDFDEEALRPYFPLDRVISGMFEIVHRLYGIRVVEKEGVPVWDPQVKYYEIYDGGTFIRRGSYRCVLCGLVSTRKQARRRVDGFADYRGTAGRSPRATFRHDLRQPDSAGRGSSIAVDASRCANHLPRVRTSAAPLPEQSGAAGAGGSECGLGLRGAAVANHGELVLGARGAGFVCPALPDRRAGSTPNCSTRCGTRAIFGRRMGRCGSSDSALWTWRCTAMWIPTPASTCWHSRAGFCRSSPRPSCPNTMR